MPTTLLEVADFIAPCIGENGICPVPASYPQIIRTANRVIPMLMKRLDAKGTLVEWSQRIESQILTLPYDCLEIRQCWLNNRALEQRDSFYQGQLGVGQKCAGPWVCRGHELIDLGDDFALPYDWPPHFDTRYGLVAESNADAGHGVTVRFKNRLGDLLTETITLAPDQQLSTTASDVTQVVFQSKGQTNGALRGYIYYPQTGAQVWCGTFPSFVAIPRFRKKKIPHCHEVRCPSTLVILGKLRFFPVQNITDEIPISDPEALAWGCRALNALQNSRTQEYNDNMTFAINELDRQLYDESSRATVSQIQITGPWGRHAFGHSIGWR
jgi:hypothetical protein